MTILYVFGFFFLMVSIFMYFYTKDQKDGVSVVLDIVNIDATGIKDDEGIILYSANNIDVTFDLNGEKMNKRIHAEQVYSVGEKIKAIYYPKSDSFNFGKENKSTIYVAVAIFMIAITMLVTAILGTFNVFSAVKIEEKAFQVFKYIFSFGLIIGGILSIRGYLKIRNKPQVDAEIIGIKKAWSSSAKHSIIVNHYLYKYSYNGEKTYLSDVDIQFPRKKIGDHVILIIDGKDVYEKSLKIDFLISGIAFIVVGLILLLLIFNNII